MEMHTLRFGHGKQVQFLFEDVFESQVQNEPATEESPKENTSSSTNTSSRYTREEIANNI